MPLDRITDANVAADQGGGHVGSVAIDLRDALLRLGTIDGTYIVVEEIPAGVRFSAGRFNGDDTWSLAPDEIDGLQAILPSRLSAPFALTVRVLTPDPYGYDYASTTAKFDIIVTPDCSSAAVSAMGGRMEPPDRSPLPAANAPAFDDPRAAEERRLAAAHAEWAAEEEHRLARNRAHWEALEQERWLAREAALGARQAAALADAGARWKQREVNRIAAVEAQWSARLAASEARWRAEDEQRRAVAPPARTKRRGLVANLAAAFGLSCIAVAVWML